MSEITKDAGILVTGASGIIGHAVCEELKRQGYENVLAPSHREMDLMDAGCVETWMRDNRPAAVVHCAALSGSADIMRDRAAEILSGNILMQTYVLMAAAKYAKKAIYIASGSAYGPLAETPFREEQAVHSIQPGSLEGYAVSKIAGICLCKQITRSTGKPFVSVLPTHIYGCHSVSRVKEAVVDVIILRLLEAKYERRPEVTLDIWGTGKLCKRQYLHVQDCARAIAYLLENYDGEEPVNLATPEAVSLDDVVCMAQQFICYEGGIRYLTERKEVASVRLMSTEKLMGLGFKPLHSMLEWIQYTVAEYEKLLSKKYMEDV